MSFLKRVRWQADLTPGPDEPLAKSLLKYRQSADRQPHPEGNLVSSHLEGSRLHAPVLDLDTPHVLVRSTSDGHSHLYIDVPMTRFKMFVMLAGLYFAGVIEMGNFWWTLRRGAMFVRHPDVPKAANEKLTYTYGMFFKLKDPENTPERSS